MWCLEKVNYVRGDANLDGNYNVNDATYIRRYVADMETLNNKQLFLGDANYDGVVNIKDATRIESVISDLLVY